MAADPKAKFMHFSYKGGTAATARGNWEYLFPGTGSVWTCPTDFETDSLGRRKIGKSVRRKRNSRGGRIAYVRNVDGDVATFRYTGAFIDFVKNVICKAGTKVVEVWTQRGSSLGPDELAAFSGS